MKTSTSIAIPLMAGIASAFPQLLPPSLSDNFGSIGDLAAQALTDIDEAASPTFDALGQLIDVLGSHSWQAPGLTDVRGPCPGLNALANHGYLPRNGYATIPQYITATTTVFGMGLDLATILAAYGAALDGALIGWSIGGQEHTGIGGSHNNYETDSSPMRGDLNQYGSNVNLVLSQFQDLYNLQPDAATANYDLGVIGTFRAKRYSDSVSKNPYFFYAPFSGTVVSQAAFTFIYRFMANHTAAQPDGILDQSVLKSFFAISGPDSDLKWTPGYERIPDNWYKRATNSPYGVSAFSTDIGTLSQSYPYISVPGCNTGTINSFVNITQTNTNLSAYDFSNPIDGFCYGIASALEAATNVPVVNTVIDELLLPLQNTLGCPTIDGQDLTVGKACPGYSLYGGPTGKIAPGAVSN